MKVASTPALSALLVGLLAPINIPAQTSTRAAFDLSGSAQDRARFLALVDRCAMENDYFRDRLDAFELVNAGIRVRVARDLEGEQILVAQSTDSLQVLDLADLEAFPPYEQADGSWLTPPGTPVWATRHCGVILHELMEGFWIQRHGYTIKKAHVEGVSAENRVGYSYGRAERRTDAYHETLDQERPPCSRFVVVVGTIAEPKKYHERFNITGVAKLDRPQYGVASQAPKC